MKTFKISGHCLIKICASLKWRAILKIPNSIFREICDLLPDSKMKPLGISIFLCTLRILTRKQHLQRNSTVFEKSNYQISKSMYKNQYILEVLIRLIDFSENLLVLQNYPLFVMCPFRTPHV